MSMSTKELLLNTGHVSCISIMLFEHTFCFGTTVGSDGENIYQAARQFGFAKDYY